MPPARKWDAPAAMIVRVGNPVHARLHLVQVAARRTARAVTTVSAATLARVYPPRMISERRDVVVRNAPVAQHVAVAQDALADWANEEGARNFVRRGLHFR